MARGLGGRGGRAPAAYRGGPGAATRPTWGLTILLNVISRPWSFQLVPVLDGARPSRTWRPWRPGGDAPPRTAGSVSNSADRRTPRSVRVLDGAAWRSGGRAVQRRAQRGRPCPPLVPVLDAAVPATRGDLGGLDGVPVHADAHAVVRLERAVDLTKREGGGGGGAYSVQCPR